MLVTTNPRFTTIVRIEEGARPILKLLRHGPVALALSQATAARANARAVARVLDSAAEQVVERAQLAHLSVEGPPIAVASEVGRALVTLAGEGRSSATTAEVRRATELLAATWVDGAKEELRPAWIEPMMIASAVLGAILLGLDAPGIALARAASPAPKG
jgi:hypothetical protein